MKAPRGLDKALFAKLAAGDWIDRHQNLIVIGPTGVGKSWIACALAHTACRNDRSVLYHRLPRLFDALALARGDGRHARLLKTIARVQLLILDDWGLANLTPDQGRDLLAIIDDRHRRGSTVVINRTTQPLCANLHKNRLPRTNGSFRLWSDCDWRDSIALTRPFVAEERRFPGGSLLEPMPQPLVRLR